MKHGMKFAVVTLALLLVSSFAGTSLALPTLQIQGNLTQGSYGPDVVALQNVLAEAGFFTDVVDGVYDATTAEAVKRMQEALGVHRDGAFGPQTQAAYNFAILSGSGLFSSDSVREKGSTNALSGCVIGIDPGHQQVQDRTLEVMGPDTDRTKARMSAGSKGVKTGTEEYSINLQVALKLQSLLEQAGATVVMTRTKNDVSISNRERAGMMNKAGVDVWIRLHCDSSGSADQSGARVLVPSRSNNAEIYRESLRLGKSIIESFCRVTEAKKRAISARTDQTGFNWSEVPVVALEMGYLSNVIEDTKLNSDAYQAACAQGIFDGLVEYFALEKTE